MSSANNSSQPGSAGGILLPHYGLLASAEDLVSFLVVLGLLSDRATHIEPRGDDGEAPGPDFGTAAVGAAQQALEIFQRDTNFLAEGHLEIYLEGLGIEADDFEARFLEAGERAVRAAEFARNLPSQMSPLLSHLLYLGVVDHLILVALAVRHAGRRASKLGLEIDPVCRDEVHAFLAWLHWQRNYPATRRSLARFGMSATRVDEIVEALALARTFVRYKKDEAAKRDAETGELALRHMLVGRKKVPDDLVYGEGSAETVKAIEDNKAAIGITRVTDITNLDTIGVPNIAVVRPMSEIDISVFSGKGITKAEALASGLVEATEVFCAERVRETKTETLRSVFRSDEVNGAAFIDPRDFVLPSTFAESPYDAGKEIEWARAHDLVGGGSFWVPLEIVEFSRLEYVYLTAQTGSGLGAGNSIEAAILHGLCEAVERDAYLCAWFAINEAGLDPVRLNYTRISLEEPPPQLVDLVERVEKADLRLILLNCTGDVGIPSVWSIMLEDHPSGGDVDHPMDGLVANMGFGTHPNPVIATRRAILESIQCHTVNIQGARESLSDITKTMEYRIYPRSSDRILDHEEDGGGRRVWRRFVEHTATYNKRFADVLFNPLLPEVRLEQMGGQENRDIRDDIEFAVRKLAAAGMNRVLYVDLEHPEVGVPVVRVLVPELQPITTDRLGWRCLRHLCEPNSWAALTNRQR